MYTVFVLVLSNILRYTRNIPSGTIRVRFARPASVAVSTRLPSWDISALYCRILRMSVRFPRLPLLLSLSRAHPIVSSSFPRFTRVPFLLARVRLSAYLTPHQLLLSGICTLVQLTFNIRKNLISVFDLIAHGLQKCASWISVCIFLIKKLLKKNLKEKL